MKRFAPLIMSVAIVGCVVDPKSASSTDNPKITDEILFSSSGCNIHRFMDEGRNHYWVLCSQNDTMKTTAAISQFSCGKSCITDELIETTVVPNDTK